MSEEDKERFDDYVGFELGFNIQTIANGWIVRPWGELDSSYAHDIHVFNSKEQLCEFILFQCANYSIPKGIEVKK